MLSSIILSMAMSVSPTTVADVHNLDIQEVGEVRKRNRIHHENRFETNAVGEVRKKNRILNKNAFETSVVGEVRKKNRI